jgi:hypothetical protein
MKYAGVFLLMCSLALPAAADVLYDNTVLTNAVTGIGPITTCGPSGCTQSVGISIDDVLIPVARDPGGLPVSLTQVTVGVSGDPGTTPTFSLWDFPVLPDGSPGLPQQLIATKDLTFTNGDVQNLAFGDGSSPIATLQPNTGAVPGYGLLYLGLSASITADWAWANGPDFNLPTAWFYNGFSTTIYLDTSPPNFPPNFSYDLRVEGETLPEPSLLLPLAGLLAVIGWLRFRTARES